MARQAPEEFGDGFSYDARLSQVAEATGANIFFLRDGVIHSPIPHCFPNGITRQTVIELAKCCGIAVIERAIQPEEPGFSSETLMNDYMKEVYPAAVAAE